MPSARYGSRVFPTQTIRTRFIDGNPGRVEPEFFEFVVGPRLVLEDMNDHVAVVHEDPPGMTRSLDPQRSYSALLQHLLDMLDDGSYLGRGLAGADDEIVGNDREVSECEDEGIFCLLVDRRPRRFERRPSAVFQSDSVPPFPEVLYQNQTSAEFREGLS